MPTMFNLSGSTHLFEHHETVPKKIVNLRIKDESAYKIKLSVLHLYGLYRRTVYNSYRNNTAVADDIKTYLPLYTESSHDPIYHYAVNHA